MNPFENEKKEIDEYSLAEIEKLYGFDPRAYDNDFEEVEPLDDDEYMLFIAGVEPEDIEDKDDDPDDEPIQDPAVCDDGRCGPKYDDDFDVPAWPEWQEEDEIEEISDTEPLTEDVLTEVNPIKAIGKGIKNLVTGGKANALEAVKKLFNPATSLYTSNAGAGYFLISTQPGGSVATRLTKTGEPSPTGQAEIISDYKTAVEIAKNKSKTNGGVIYVRGYAPGLNNKIQSPIFKNNMTTIYAYNNGGLAEDNVKKIADLCKADEKLRNIIGVNAAEEQLTAPQYGFEGEATSYTSMTQVANSTVWEATVEFGTDKNKVEAFKILYNEQEYKLPAGTTVDAGKKYKVTFNTEDSKVEIAVLEAATEEGSSGVTEELTTTIQNGLKAYKPESIADLINTLKAAPTAQATFKKSLETANNNITKIGQALRNLVAWYILTTGKTLEKV